MAEGFEFDPLKSASNKARHGIDFVESQALWSAYFRQEIAKSVDGESRYANFGKINNQHWTAIITYRGTVRRIISVFRSTPRQIKSYEQSKRS